MSEQDINHGERDNEELDQEQLDNGGQQETEDDIVKLPRKDFDKIKKQLKTANSEAAQRRKELERFESYGLSPDEIEELAALRDKGGEKQQEQDDSRVDRRELEKQRKSLEQKYKGEIEAKEKEIASMQQRLERTLIDSAAREAIIAEKGVPELVLGEATKSAKLFTNDRGGYDVRVVDEDGNVEFNDRGEYMTLKDRVLQLKQHETFGRAFEATVKQGGGVTSQQGNRKPKSSVTKSKLQADKQALHAYIKEHGIAAYNDLPA